jgi:putative intracellular protease/amidase
MERLNVGILIFDGVEVLDFAGPFEVFSRTRLVAGLDSRRSEDEAPFHVFTVGRTRETVHATGDLLDRSGRPHCLEAHRRGRMTAVIPRVGPPD